MSERLFVFLLTNDEIASDYMLSFSVERADNTIVSRLDEMTGAHRIAERPPSSANLFLMESSAKWNGHTGCAIH